MKLLLRLEEAAQAGAAVGLLAIVGAPWWCYPLLLVGPDIGMLGYLAGPRLGAFTYNLLHHKGVALLALAVSLIPTLSGSAATVREPVWWLLLAGLVLYGHASLDRLFGYGLKYPDSFQNTHLGRIGRRG